MRIYFNLKMIMIQTPDFQVWNRSWYSCVRCRCLPLEIVIYWSMPVQKSYDLVFNRQRKNFKVYSLYLTRISVAETHWKGFLHWKSNLLKHYVERKNRPSISRGTRFKNSAIYFRLCKIKILQERERSILDVELIIPFCLKLQLFLEATHRWRSNLPEFQRHK